MQDVFDDYKRLCKKMKNRKNANVPILLFNEADAVFQKRTEFFGGGAEKTENAMQNIILENMETFEGILIATTNLAANLDAAFERRFLYKIKFENPSAEAKTAIWQEKLNWLSYDEAEQLAAAYDFSGGEIDNIVRKSAMEEIISGKKVSLAEIEAMCRTEKLNVGNAKKIGFV